MSRTGTQRLDSTWTFCLRRDIQPVTLCTFGETTSRGLYLAGDVLFQGGVGRTDFPDGSFEQLRSSIQDKLFALPDDTVVLPGHGPSTTIGEEKQSNPFVGIGG